MNKAHVFNDAFIMFDVWTVMQDNLPPERPVGVGMSVHNDNAASGSDNMHAKHRHTKICNLAQCAKRWWHWGCSASKQQITTEGCYLHSLCGASVSSSWYHCCQLTVDHDGASLIISDARLKGVIDDC